MKRIVVATDFSESSEQARLVAREYARRFGATLHLLHVAPPIRDPVPDERLTALAAESNGALQVVTAVRSGVPAVEIVRYAAEQGSDLIVMGTHGRTGVSRALIGSVAERVVRTARCPVLTVPLHRREPAAAPEVEPEAVHRCRVCAQPSEDLICEGCRARIRGEALERKQREERGGRA